MNDAIANVPAPIWIAIGGVVTAFIAVYRSRSDAAHKITQAAMDLLDEYKRDLDSVKSDLAISQENERLLTGRVSSLEQNEEMNSHRMQEMEIEQGKLKEELRQKDIKNQKLLFGIEQLTKQVLKHDSEPDWKPED